MKDTARVFATFALANLSMIRLKLLPS